MRTLIKTLISLFILAGALSPQAMFFSSNLSSGPMAPTFVSATGSVIVGSGSTYTTSAINVPSGSLLVVVYGQRGSSSTNSCSFISGVTGDGGADTFTAGPTKVNAGTFTACVGTYYKFNPTANASYTIVLATTGSPPSSFPVSVMLFNAGSVVGTADGTCNNKSEGATSLTCSSAIIPTGTLEISVVAQGSYDDPGSPTDNSTPSYTIPSGCEAGSSLVGGIGCGYYIGNPPAGSLTPGIKTQGAGDPLALVGAAFK